MIIKKLTFLKSKQEIIEVLVLENIDKVQNLNKSKEYQM